MTPFKHIIPRNNTIHASGGGGGGSILWSTVGTKTVPVGVGGES